MEHDAAGRPLEVIGPTGEVTRFSYDAQGRTASVENPAGQTTRFEYVGASTFLASMVMADGLRQSFHYDGQMNLTEVRLNSQPILRMSYSADGLLEKVKEWGESDRSLVYDAAGRLSAISDAMGNQTRLEYGAQGNLARVIDPLGGVTILQLRRPEPSGEPHRLRRSDCTL